jgi:hypothetical protein
MRRERRQTARILLTLAFASLSSPRPALADPRGGELRLQLLGASYRWSEPIAGTVYYNTWGRKSLYFAPGLGGRLFPKRGSHGVLAELESRLDTRADDPWCLFNFDEGTCPSFRTDYAVWHAGYAFRHIVPSPKRPERRSWTFTPHVSIAAGWAKNLEADIVLPPRSPIVGARVGFDIDLHFRVVFIGWSFSYEAIAQTRGPVGWSQFFAWNAIPAFRIGFDLGPRSRN